MKSYDNYAQLELLSTHSTNSLLYPPTAQPEVRANPGGRIAKALHKLGSACVKFLAGNPNPTIRQKRDRHGNVYYKAHDPISYTSHYFSSEHDVRVWLDKRYNR